VPEGKNARTRISKQLHLVIEQTECLSDEALAAAWEEMLDARAWETCTQKPDVRATVRRLAAEPLRETGTGVS
jgi:hypothetical protein